MAERVIDSLAVQAQLRRLLRRQKAGEQRRVQAVLQRVANGREVGDQQ